MTDFIYIYISVRNEIMLEKLTILISSDNKNFIQRHSRRQNKSISKFIDDLLSSVERQASKSQLEDKWIETTAGSYTSGKKDILKELFKGIVKQKRSELNFVPFLSCPTPIKINSY